VLLRARWLALGALAMYFSDPQGGARRRHVLRDRTLAVPRRLRRRLGRGVRFVRAGARAAVARATHVRERPKDLNDATLADKVQSEVFRDPRLPKGDVNVNVEQGRVVLRGQVDSPELVEELERRVRRVVGVREVENLLHLPGTEPPHHSAWDG
jgi:hypothetical protein